MRLVQRNNMRINKDDTVTISAKEYDELILDQIFLNCLQNNGVDNWTWYSEAQEEFSRIVGQGDDEE